MGFNSISFILFINLTIFFFWLLKTRQQNIFLLVISYFFYASWDWRFLGLIFLSTLIDYTLGRKIDQTSRPKIRKTLLITSITSNLCILGFFKYFNFFTTSMKDLVNIIGWNVELNTLNIVLPIGISFYTFQSMSYTIDVYKRKISAEKNIVDFALYIAFFPQLVAGPIERAIFMLAQIKAPRSMTWDLLESGIWLIIVGFFKKLVIADNLAPFVRTVFDSPKDDLSPLYVLGAGYALVLQVYCDFSGYANIARGSANLLGFKLSRNFQFPLFSRSPVEFWRRWHMTLTKWFHDYVFLPLAKSTSKSFSSKKLSLGLAVVGTMALVGFWHGANWTFILWGVLHGLIILVYHVLGLKFHDKRLSLRNILGTLVWFHIWMFIGFLYRINELGHLGIFAASVNNPWSLDGVLWSSIVVFGACLFLLEVLQIKYGEYCIRAMPKASRALGFALLLIFVLLSSYSGYQRFEYFQF